MYLRHPRPTDEKIEKTSDSRKSDGVFEFGKQHNYVFLVSSNLRTTRYTYETCAFPGGGRTLKGRLWVVRPLIRLSLSDTRSSVSM